MVENRENEEIDIPTQGEGWFTDLPDEVSTYQYPIYYRYTKDDETISKKDIATSSLKPNIGPIINEGYTLNIFVRDDLVPEKKRFAFLHELYESYYIHSLGIDSEEAHRKAQKRFSFH